MGNFIIFLMLAIAAALLICIMTKSKQKESDPICKKGNENNRGNQRIEIALSNKSEDVRLNVERKSAHHVAHNIEQTKTNSQDKAKQSEEPSSAIVLPNQDKSDIEPNATNKNNCIEEKNTGLQEKGETNLPKAKADNNEANNQCTSEQNNGKNTKSELNGGHEPIHKPQSSNKEPQDTDSRHVQDTKGSDTLKKQAQPYTVVSVPFLSDVFDIDYTKKVYFKYDLNASKELKYPLMRTPQKDTEIKLPVHGRSGKRGFSEHTLCNAIKKYGLEKFYDNLTVFAEGCHFEPDLAYIDADKGIFIDIEIDEPYAGYERKPIHYKINNNATVDDRRNKHFTDRGWIVIRFSEKQIVEQCGSCLKYIYNVIRKMDSSSAIPKSLVCFSDLKEETMWTKDDAQWKKNNKEREKMLKISEFICSSKVLTQVEVTDYKGSEVIERNVKRKHEEEVWKRCSVQKKWQDYIDRYPRGRFVNQAKKEIDKSLWEECKKQKMYERYLKETKIGEFKTEAEDFILKEQKFREECRRKEQEHLIAIRDEEERKKKEALAEQKRREEDERKKQEAERYERQNITTVHSSPKTPSSRGYA